MHQPLYDTATAFSQSIAICGLGQAVSISQQVTLMFLHVWHLASHHLLLVALTILQVHAHGPL
jgi:hypothetical protein